ncbi:hypothetical protein ABM031_00980 [Morganella morganii]|uniref:hypothetical protein n=1 Tax=Morganella morganii TaxID=582 RepID=UPI000C99A79D|nr:hypothetical protein [Morganella morganii]AUR32496.1 hypothetical protein C1O70_13835 [Morganella morganii]HDS5613611.1 hypothetical protein [Morganella morganii subsp. morganii]
MENIIWQIAITITSVIAALVTAVSTFFLWRVTRMLAVETKKMAESASQPHIVITLEPTDVSINHFNMVISNTGNATAYNIISDITPSINDKPIPFQNVSVLKPGDSIKSFFTSFFEIKNKEFKITTTWLKKPESKDRISNSYIFDIGSYTNLSVLGDMNPLLTVSKEIKKISENINKIVKSNKLQVNTYDKNDRIESDNNHRKMIEEYKKIKGDI